MDNENSTYEFTAPTVEEAVEKGLEELGLTRSGVDVEVLDEGKRNVFRFASRAARVKLIPLSDLSIDNDEVFEERKESGELSDYTLSDEEIAYELSEKAEGLSETELSVKRILKDILAQMSVDANITTKIIKSTEDDRDVVYANIEGDDLSFLIGRKSETLNALQYLTGLIVSKKAGHWIPLQVDIQSYRTRRETELKKIAHRLAEQVISSGRKQFLEPMPANERRIIHMEIRNYAQLMTESIGEEPNRKVTIALRK